MTIPRLTRVATLVLLLILAGAARAQMPTWRWASAPPITCTAMATDAAGNVYMTGSFIGTVTLGSTTLTSVQQQVFVAKLDGGGAFQWAVQAQGTGPDRVGSTGLVLAPNGEIYICGFFRTATLTLGSTVLTNSGGSVFPQDDAFVAKLDPAGAWQWGVSTAGAGFEQAAGLALDAGQRVYVTGSFSGPTATFGPHVLTYTGPVGSQNMFAARLSPAGVWEWAANAPGAITASAGIAVTGRGEAYVFGVYGQGAADFGATTLPLPVSLFQPNVLHGFVAKLTAAGAWQWAQAIQSVNGLSTRAIAADSSGNVFITGGFGDFGAGPGGGVLHFGPDSLVAVSTGDTYVAKLSPAGSLLWGVRAGGGPSGPGVSGSTYSTGNALMLDANGDAYVAGDFSSPTATFGADTITNFDQAGAGGPQDLYVAKLSAAGVWQWAVAAGGLNNETATVLAVDETGAATIAGNSDFIGRGSFMNFGNIRLRNPGANGFGFLARLGVAGVGLPEAVPTSSLILAPNPAHYSVRLTGAPTPETTATLLDALGRVVRVWPLAPNRPADLDLCGLPAGLYTVRAGAVARRLVVE